MAPPAEVASEAIRVRGLVQGVGLRPTVWRLATRYSLAGWVANDGEGVSILASGSPSALHAFVTALRREAPPLARIERIERQPAAERAEASGFHILESRSGRVRTGIVPDAAPCAACAAEIADPASRRHHYAFTNCTHCGPRLSIVEALPYDRHGTTMRGFALCEACRREYEDPGDRRFHAQPVACPRCGPRLQLMPTPAGLARGGWRSDAQDPASDQAGGALLGAVQLLQAGAILAIKGVGGYQFACDARSAAAVGRLRQLKAREGKPFALIARDLMMVRAYCCVDAEEAALLQSPAAPIVLLQACRKAADRAGSEPELAAQVAPGLHTLGFMLPPTPLHWLLLQHLPAPLVLTSGNRTDEPQCIDDAEAMERFADLADALLLHDRPIARRVDDSVVRVSAGAPRLLRRSRGYAPTPLPLPDGFAGAPAILAMGAEQKNTFCLLREGQAIVSHHIGGLHEARTYADYRRGLDDYLKLYEHTPEHVAVDLHPEYLSRKLGLALAAQGNLPLAEVQHHHAHVAACLAENGIALEPAPVLAVVLDGLGWGEDGTLWGGEFLLADYRGYRRLASLAPVAMPGGAQAIREPWRSTYAHLRAALGWQSVEWQAAGLPFYEYLRAKPLAMLDAMIDGQINSPRASSCGRLFDAVAATLGLCTDRAWFEAQPAMELEALAAAAPQAPDKAYAFATREEAGGIMRVDAAPMWQALLSDLAAGVSPARISRRFHAGLSQLVADLAAQLAERLGLQGQARCVALCGGVFQNALLLEQTARGLSARGFRALTMRQLPANDGGLSFGQAVVAAARLLQPASIHPGR